MFYDIVRQKKVTSTSVFTDHISNYYLMVQIIASLDQQRVNITNEPFYCTLRILHNMVHLVRVTFRDLSNTYGGDTREIELNLTPQGLVKGNEADPELLAIVNSPPC